MNAMTRIDTTRCASCGQLESLLAKTEAARLDNFLAKQKLEAEVARLRREIMAAGNNPEGFDWSVLARLDRLDAAEAEVARLRESAEKMENDLADFKRIVKSQADDIGEFQEEVARHKATIEKLMEAGSMALHWIDWEMHPGDYRSKVRAALSAAKGESNV